MKSGQIFLRQSPVTRTKLRYDRVTALKGERDIRNVRAYGKFRFLSF
jgi:hypothetical protein